MVKTILLYFPRKYNFLFLQASIFKYSLLFSLQVSNFSSSSSVYLRISPRISQKNINPGEKEPPYYLMILLPNSLHLHPLPFQINFPLSNGSLSLTDKHVLINVSFSKKKSKLDSLDPTLLQLHCLSAIFLAVKPPKRVTYAFDSHSRLRFL